MVFAAFYGGTAIAGASSPMSLAQAITYTWLAQGLLVLLPWLGDPEVAQAVRTALARAHADRVVLIGQSFGADMLHVGLTGLPADLRARVQLVALVVPTDTVYYQASPAEMLTFSDPDAAALPTARQLTWIRALCVQGAEEKDSLCPRLTQPNMRRVALPGGHYLNYDSDALYRVLHQAVVASDQAPNMSKGNRS
jgi:type IV secretory pathway VirJ component